MQIHRSGGGGPHAGCGPPVDSLLLDVSGTSVVLLLVELPLDSAVVVVAVLLVELLSPIVPLEPDVDIGPPQKPCSHFWSMPHCESSSHGRPAAPSPLKQLASSPTRIDARRNVLIIAESAAPHEAARIAGENGRTAGMRHELIAAAVLLSVSACEKKATQSPDGVTLSASAGGNNASATVPTSGSNTTPSGATPSGTTPSGTTPAGTTPSGTDTTTTPPPEKTGTPAVVQGEPEVKGELDKEKLKSAIVAVDSQTLACYKSALDRTPGWTGTVKVRFIVSGKGKVLSADLAEALPDNALAQCVLTAVKAAKLPKPSNGKDVIFTLPLSLELQ